MNVGGVLWGDRVLEYKGTANFSDDKNKLTADITMPINQHGWVSSWFSSKSSPPTDYFAGAITQDGKQISYIEGSWLGGIEFDGVRYWTYTDPIFPHVSVDEKTALPSDVRYREDIQVLKTGDAKAAADMKMKLEGLQRRDAGLRKEHKEKTGLRSSRP